MHSVADQLHRLKPMDLDQLPACIGSGLVGPIVFALHRKGTINGREEAYA